jgi:glycerol uptake facilitator protein
MRPSLLGELVAEFLGTLVLIARGNGVVAMVVLLNKGGYENITLGWGLAVTLGVCVASRVSGAHLNPAVTLAVAIFRDFPWRKVVPYSLAQLAGAFAGAALVYANYLPAFREVDPDLSHTAGVFTTFPLFPEAWAFGLLDQVVGTALLLGLIFAITDARNQPVAASLNAIMVGLVGGDRHFLGRHAWLRHQPGPRPWTTTVHTGRRLPEHRLRHARGLGAGRGPHRRRTAGSTDL